MLKKSLLIFTAAAMLLLCLPAAALSPLDVYDPVGHTFSGVNAPYMTEGGLPSTTDFFTDADFAENRITVLNLWDSSCLFCRLELPYFQQVSEDYASCGVRVVGVSSTRMGGTYPAAYEYLVEFGVTYTNLIVDDGLAEIVFQNANTPQTFFVNSEGTVMDYIREATTYEELTEKLCALLYIAGDADANGELTFADVTSAYIYMTGGAELNALGRLNADFNGDGEVSFADISALYLMMIGANA